MGDKISAYEKTIALLKDIKGIVKDGYTITISKDDIEILDADGNLIGDNEARDKKSKGFESVVLDDIEYTENPHSLYFILASMYAMKGEIFSGIVMKYGNTKDIDKILDKLDVIETAIKNRYKKITGEPIFSYNGDYLKKIPRRENFYYGY